MALEWGNTLTTTTLQLITAPLSFFSSVLEFIDHLQTPTVVLTLSSISPMHDSFWLPTNGSFSRTALAWAPLHRPHFQESDPVGPLHRLQLPSGHIFLLCCWYLYRLTGTSCSPTRGSTMSRPWKGSTRGCRASWECPAGKQLCTKGPGPAMLSKVP